MRSLRLLVALPALAAGLVANVTTAPPASAAQPIQPGMYIASNGAACTGNFIYDGTGSQAGKVYLGTAAHCVTGGVGSDVADSDGVVFGDVALVGDENSTIHDYAFIEVRSAALSRVTPGVLGYPAYPTGYTLSSETALGDLVQQSGWGLGFEFTAATRQKRQSVLTGDTAQRHQVLGAVIFGDSGGPLVHVRTGKALGIVSRLCIGACEEEGPTVEGLLGLAAGRGFTVDIREA